jgi:hypothetical protein
MEVGGTIHFGAYDWRVLDVQGDRALILTTSVVERRVYHGIWSSITWESCGLREYLNAEFYSTFSKEQQARIKETTNQNPPNQWLKTDGGRETKDRVFLLNLDEVVRYLGNSGQLENRNPNSKYWINDQYNASRRTGLNRSRAWWWLRSPGMHSNCAVFVGGGGAVCISGHRVVNELGGVRPALWLDKDSGGCLL